LRSERDLAIRARYRDQSAIRFVFGANVILTKNERIGQMCVRFNVCAVRVQIGSMLFTFFCSPGDLYHSNHSKQINIQSFWRGCSLAWHPESDSAVSQSEREIASLSGMQSRYESSHSRYRDQSAISRSERDIAIRARYRDQSAISRSERDTVCIQRKMYTN
jgi:hypothetical protein